MTLWDRIDSGRPLQTLILVATAVIGAALAYVGALIFAVAVMLGPGYLVLGDPPYVSIVTTLLVARWVGAVAAAIFLLWTIRGPRKASLALMRRLGARPVSLERFPVTRSALEDMKIATGLPVMPSLYVVDSMAVNAAMVPAGGRLLLLVTYGFATELNGDAQRAVFASLIGRHASGRLYGLYALSQMVGPAHAVSDWAASLVSSAARSGRHGAAHFSPFTVAAALATLFAITRISGSALWTWLLALLVGAALPVVLTISWLVTALSYRAAIALAHQGDTEGMLLLKDPASMLRTIETVIQEENGIPFSRGAGALFFCWPVEVFGYVEDPELARVARLRPLLGAAAVGTDL